MGRHFILVMGVGAPLNPLYAHPSNSISLLLPPTLASKRPIPFGILSFFVFMRVDDVLSSSTDGGNSFPSVCVMVGAMLFPLFVGA